MLSAYKDSFISAFPFCIPYISFSPFTALARISSTALRRSDDGEHPYLFPDLSRKASSYSPLRMMLAVGFCGCSLLS